MRSVVYLIASIMILGACRSTPLAQNSLEYKIDDQTYAVVVPQEEGMSDEEVKKTALKKAIEIAKAHDFQYITIEKEEKGALASTKNNPQLPQNLYYEDIQTRDFGKDRNLGGPIPYTTPAYKLTFKGYKERPLTLKTVIEVNS
jgi:hypothetical protein